MTLSILNMARLTVWMKYRIEQGARRDEVIESLPHIFPEVSNDDFIEFHELMIQVHREVAVFWNKQTEEFERRAAEVLDQECMRLGITIINGGKK